MELAGDLSGRRAWCVGDRTAELAAAAGAEARSAGGDVAALERLLLSERPERLVYLRGEPSRGDLAARLCAAGADVGETVLYRTEARPLTVEAARALESGAQPVVAPVFSPRGAALLAAAAPRLPAVVVAISAAAAEPFVGRCKIVRAGQPDAEVMRQLVLSELGNLP